MLGGCLYVQPYQMAQEGIDGKLYLNNTHEMPTNFEDVLFTPSLLTNEVVNVEGNPVTLTEGVFAACKGTYVYKTGNRSWVSFWLEDESIHFFLNDRKQHLPFTKVFFLTDQKTKSFKSLDSLYPGSCMYEKFAKRYEGLVHETRRKVRALKEMPVAPQVHIQCLDGSFLFYPNLISIAFSLGESHFQTGCVEIALEYSLDEVKPFCKLLLTERLPLIAKDKVELYTMLSEELKLDFWTEYLTAVKKV